MAKNPLFIWQKSPIYMAKKPYLYGKRALSIWQKRPMHIGAPQVSVSVKRALFIWQKSPVYMAEEAYAHWRTSGMPVYL